MEALILIALIAFNGVFAMSEIALVTSRKARLLNLASEGRTSADIALRLGENPTCFLSTIQIGITSIGILNGIVGESVLAAPFSIWLHSFGLPENVAGFVATGTVVLLITYVSIVIGELVPKRIGQINAESIACLVSRPIHALSLVTRPFVQLLSFSTNALLRIMGIEQKGRNSVTEDEIRAMLDEGEEFEGGLNARKYQAITKTSKATATRDLQDLVEKKIIISKGAGRSTNYQVDLM